MSLLDRTSSVSKQSPSSLLPSDDDEVLRKAQSEEVSRLGPSSLLPPDQQSGAADGAVGDISRHGPSSLLPPDEGLPNATRPTVDESGRLGPSSLLPETKGEQHHAWRSEDTAAISPSELAPLPVPGPRRLPRGLAWAALVLAVILIGGFVVGQHKTTRKSVPELLQAAAASSAAGKYEAAVVHLKNALQSDQNNPEIRYRLGLAHHATASFAAAEEQFRRALDLGYERSRALAGLGRALLLQGKHEAVLAEIQRDADSEEPRTGVEIRTIRALAYLGVGNLEEAKILLRQVLELAPQTVDALLGSARIAAIEQRPKDAQVLVEKAISLDGRSLDALLMKADLEWALGGEAAATVAYGDVLKVYPANPQAHLSLAWLAIRSKKFDLAAAHAHLARKSAPGSPQVNYVTALLEFRRGRLKDAREAVDRALRSAPRDAASLLLAGGIAYAEGRQADAQKLLLAGLERAPAHVGGRKLYAGTLLKAGQLTAALRVLLPTMQVAPEDPELLALIGQTYLQAGDTATAAEYVDRAAKLKPKDAATLTRLGLSRVAAGQFTQAISELEIGSPRGDGTPDLDALKVISYIHRGDFLRAHSAWESLNRKRPDSPETQHLKAAILSATNDSAGARKALEVALILDPTFLPAVVGLAKLDIDANDPLNARRRLERFARNNPRHAQVLVVLAELGPALKASAEEVRLWLVEAHTVEPSALAPAVMLGRHFIRSAEPAKALEVTRAAQKAFPEHPDLLGVIGAAQMAVGDFDGAFATFAQIVNMFPNAVEGLYLMARAQAALRNDTAAALTLNKVLTLRPSHVEARAELGRIQVRTGRYDAALSNARQVRNVKQLEDLSFVIEGDAMMATGRYADAARAYEGALRAKPSSDIVLRYVLALQQDGKSALGEQKLRAWIDANPTDWPSRLFYADQLLAQQRYAQAKELYLAAVKLKPEHAMALNNLALTMLQTHDPRVGEYAERALRLAPEDAAVLDTVGSIALHRGDHVRALELFERAVVRAPDRAEPRLNLVKALIKAERHSKARAELERVAVMTLSRDQNAEMQRLLKDLPR